LGLCAGLDQPDSGTVNYVVPKLSSLAKNEESNINEIGMSGFVFQDFQLLLPLLLWRNVAIPLELRGDKNAMKNGRTNLDKMGLKIVPPLSLTTLWW